MNDAAATASGHAETPKAPSVGRAVARVAGGTGTSRILGLIREQLFAATLGASAYSDAFLAAFRIPGLLRGIFAEGALSTAFVPAFTERATKDGRDAAFQLSRLVMTSLGLIVSALVLGGMLAPQTLVETLAPHFDAEKSRLAATAARILMPFLLLISLSALCAGMLNAQERYTRAAMGPALFNVVSIIGGIGLWVAGTSLERAVLVWAVATVLGGLAQLAFLAIPLWRQGFRPWPRLDLRLRDPGHRRVAGLMVAALVGLAATQANLVISTIFASGSEKAISYLNYAFRLLALPLGLLGVAAGVVTSVRSSKAAAAKDTAALRLAVQQGLRFLLAFTVPASVGLVLLAVPFIRLVFERGRFTAEDTHATASALALYSVGLLGFASNRVLTSAFYAMSRPRVAVVGSLLAVAIQLAFACFAFNEYGFLALALGTSVGALGNASFLAWAFHRAYGLVTRDLFRLIAKVTVCTAIMATALIAVGRALGALLPTSGLLFSLTSAGLPVAIGGALYLFAARRCRISELSGPWRRRR